MFLPNADGPLLPAGFERYKPSVPADVGTEDYIFKSGLSFIPESYVGTGIVTATPPALARHGVLAINKTLDSGLPGILVPSFRPQPLSPQYPTG